MLSNGRPRVSSVQLEAFRCIRAVVLLLTFGSSLALAQQLPDEEARKDRPAALDCLRNPQSFAANEAKFDNYFDKYFFPSLTRTDPDSLGAMAKQREEFFKQTLARATVADAQKKLTDKTFKAMGQIVMADPPAHPAVRYNAILMIGQLDDKYSPDGRQPPVPYAKAVKPLVSIVNSGTTDKPFPPAVILGAVIGLERHVQYQKTMAPESTAAIASTLAKLVSREDPIQDMDRDTFSWLRLRAASVLAKFGTVGEKNASHDAIVKLAATARSLDDRCAAAGLLEKLEYKDVKLDDKATAEPLFTLARDLAASEDKKAAELQENFATGGGFAAGAFAGVNSDGTPSEVFPRRQVLSRLVELRNGLKKVKPSLTAESQKKADAILKALETAITTVSDKGTVELTLLDSMRKMADAINAALPAAATDKADAAKPEDNSAFETPKAG